MYPDHGVRGEGWDDVGDFLAWVGFGLLLPALLLSLILLAFVWTPSLLLALLQGQCDPWLRLTR